MKLIVLRHAETFYNEKGWMQGRADIPLSEVGIEHASQIKETIQNMDIDFTICSPLKRTKMTAALITDSPILTDYRLIERDLGDYEGQPTTLYDIKKYANIKTNISDKGVEPALAVYQRLQTFFNDIKAYHDKTILLVTHGGIIKFIPYCFKEIPEDGILVSPKIGNCEYIEINI